MPTILDYYEYAKLAAGAYVKLDGMSFDGGTLSDQANDQARLPSELANQTFFQSSENPNKWGQSQFSLRYPSRVLGI